MVFGNGSTLLLVSAQQGVGWSLTTHASEKQFDGLSQAALKEYAVAATQGWAPKFQKVIEGSNMSDLLSLGGFYDKDPAHKARIQSVVLLGDAAHPMSPFRGEGANMAMLDALVLADALLNRGTTLEGALSSYEREMLQRSRNYVLLSRNAAREMHSRNWWVQCKLKAKLRIANFFIKRRRRSGR